jgi:hypothetical protein
VEAEVSALILATLGLAFLLLGVASVRRTEVDAQRERAARRRVLRELARREEL